MNDDSRVALARADLARRQAIAHAAAHHEPPRTEEQIRAALTRLTRIRPPDTAHLAAAASLPYVLGVLTAATATLDRHQLADWYDHDPDGPRECACCSYDDRRVEWPCPDALAVLNLYAPVPS